MKVLYTSSKGRFVLTEAQADQAVQAMMNSGVLHLKSQGVVIKGSAIMEIREEDENTPLPDGRWKCALGHEHPKTDTFCNMPGLSKKLTLPGKAKLSPEQEEVEHMRGRAEMAKIRENLAKKLKMK